MTTSKMAALTKRIYSSVFLMSLRPNGRPRIESTLYNTLKSINILRATRGVRAGTRVKQRAAILSSQRIHTFITTHRRVQSTKYGAGHLATNCINIPTGTRITSKVPKFLITNACHVSNKVDELHRVFELNNVTVAIVTESWLTDSLVPVRRFPSPSRSIHFVDVSEANDHVTQNALAARNNEA